MVVKIFDVAIRVRCFRRSLAGDSLEIATSIFTLSYWQTKGLAIDGYSDFMLMALYANLTFERSITKEISV